MPGGRRPFPAPPEGPFSVPQAARLAGLSYDVVNYWARSGIIPPSVEGSSGVGHWRKFSFADVVAMKVAATLNAQGISTQKLRRLIGALPKGDALIHPLSQHRLVVHGADVLHVELVSGERRAWSLLQKPGQGVFGFVLDLPAIIKDLRERAAQESREARASA